MKIHTIVGEHDAKSSINTQSNRNKKLSFGSSKLWGAKAYKVEQRLLDRGIKTEFHNNSFVAESVERIVNVFEEIFGRKSLPQSVEFNPLTPGVYGHYKYYEEEIEFNSRYSCFDNLKKMKKEAKSGWHLIGHNEYSTTHPACTFVHEFAHSAHKGYLSQLYSNPISRMVDLSNMQIPTTIGRFIAKCKLGKYAVNGGMEEFMAERITKDICEKLTDEKFLFYGNRKDYDYSNIFSRKWNCRYSTPQAYLDYYTQQVWNCDMKEAERAEGMIEKYLEEIERPVKEEVKQKQSTFAGFLDALFGRHTNQADWLDERNKLGLQYQ